MAWRRGRSWRSAAASSPVTPVPVSFLVSLTPSFFTVAVAVTVAGEALQRHDLGPSREMLASLAASASQHLEQIDVGPGPQEAAGAVIDAGLCAPVPMAVDLVEAVFQDGKLTAEELHLQVWRHEHGHPAMVGYLEEGGWDLIHEVVIRRELRIRQPRFERLALPEPLILDVGDCLGWYSPAAGSLLFLNDDAAPGIVEVGARRPVRLRVAEVGSVLGSGTGRTAMRAEGLVDGHVAYSPPSQEASSSEGESYPLCDAGSLAPVGCNVSETVKLTGHEPIDWADYLETLCQCTANQALAGRSIETTATCCDLDRLDYVLAAAGHPAGVGCLPGFLSVLASCSARLGLRQDYGTVYAGMSSAKLRSGLASSSIVHLATQISLEPSPLVGPLRETREGWNLEIRPSLGVVPNQTRTYRLPGQSLTKTFEPFPFGLQDLAPWLLDEEVVEYKMWSDLLLGLTMTGLPGLGFLGAHRRLRQGASRAESFDLVVPWRARSALSEFAEIWMGGDERRHVVELPRHFEFVLLPTPELKRLWPSDFSFRAICPSCSHVLIYFHFEGLQQQHPELEHLVLTTHPGEPCAWPKNHLLPARHTKVWSPKYGETSRLAWPNSIEVLDALARASEEESGEALVDEQLKDKPDRIREARLTETIGQCWSYFHHFLGSDLVKHLGFARNAQLAEEFDFSKSLRPGMGLYDLYDLRKDISHPRFEVLADKVALKKELAELNCSAARVYYSSYTSPQILDIIRDLPRYAVKAAHKHHGGRGVLLVGNGQDMRSGKHVSPEDVQAITLEMWEPDPYAGEQHCFPLNDGTDRVQCVTNAPALDKDLKQAILVEELALTWDGKLGLGADEAFCFVAWSRLCFCGVMSAGGVWGGYFARDGTPFYGLPMHKETGTRDDRGAALKPPVPWPVELREEVVALAERVAHSLKADFIRVDIFPNGGVPIVAEVSIVSGWLGRANLRWGEIDAWMLGLLGERWMEGYGQAGLL